MEGFQRRRIGRGNGGAGLVMVMGEVMGGSKVVEMVWVTEQGAGVGLLPSGRGNGGLPMSGRPLWGG